MLKSRTSSFRTECFGLKRLFGKFQFVEPDKVDLTYSNSKSMCLKFQCIAFGIFFLMLSSTCSSHSSSVSLSKASSSARCSGDKPLYRFSKYSARSSSVSSGAVKPATSVGK